MLQQLRWLEYTTDNREVTGSIPVWSTNISGYSSVWLERVIWDHEAVSSNLTTRTRSYSGALRRPGSYQSNRHTQQIYSIKNNCRFEPDSKLLNSLDGEIGLRTCLQNKHKISFRCVQYKKSSLIFSKKYVIIYT